MLKAKTIEVAGLHSALCAVHLPHNGEERGLLETLITYRQGETPTFRSHCILNIEPKDFKLMKALAHKGDQHAKVLRGVIAWAKIEAPVYWWVECETYCVGHQRLSSSSTMHTEGKGLYGEELQRVKSEIPMGRMMTKIDCFSYQTLRRMVFQRHNHRLPEWKEFIDWVRTLPFANELIFDGLDCMDNGD